MTPKQMREACWQPHRGEPLGGFLMPAPPDTRLQILARALYARWLRAKWVWRRNVPLLTAEDIWWLIRTVFGAIAAGVIIGAIVGNLTGWIRYG